MRTMRTTTTTTRTRRRARVVVEAENGEPASAPALTDEPATETKAKAKPAPSLPPGPLPRPPLRVMAGLAGFGALESTYLAVQKLTGGEVACPVGGCQTALNSGYAELVGIPLSAFGAVADGLVAALAGWGALAGVMLALLWPRDGGGLEPDADSNFV